MANPIGRYRAFGKRAPLSRGFPFSLRRKHSSEVRAVHGALA
jgi:hypothetical protein